MTFGLKKKILIFGTWVQGDVSEQHERVGHWDAFEIVKDTLFIPFSPALVWRSD